MNPLRLLLRPFRKTHSCQEINQFLAEYLDGSLPSSTQAQFQAHLNKCDNCISYFEQYKTTIQMVKDQEDIVIPEQLAEHTVEFLRTKRADS